MNGACWLNNEADVFKGVPAEVNGAEGLTDALNGREGEPGRGRP